MSTLNPKMRREFTPEIRAKISAALRGPKHPYWGKSLSTEHRAKISAAKKGQHPSAKTRARMSAAHKGVPMGTETRMRMSAAQKGNKKCLGHKHTMKSRAKMSAAQKGSRNHNCGKHLSAETRARISIAISGPRHPAWLGGISREPYTWEFNKELREEVRRRDGHRCQLCGVPQMECKRKLDVHHIDYDKENSDPVNLITLCRSCNMRVNVNRKHWIALFQKMMKEGN